MRLESSVSHLLGRIHGIYAYVFEVTSTIKREVLENDMVLFSRTPQKEAVRADILGITIPYRTMGVVAKGD